MSEELKNKKFLVIDDFLTFRQAMKKMLISIDAKDIDTADSGESAIKEMEIKSYDIILCDYNLGIGKKDGQQVLEEAKHRSLIKYSTIFIMLTAENTMPMVMGAVEYQPDDYLIKPIAKEILRSRMEKIIRKKVDFEDIEKAIDNKEYMSAIALCDERVKKNPRNMLEYLRLKSTICITIGRYDDANEVFEMVLGMRDIPWARMGVGKVHFFKGAYLKAKEVFQLIIEENKTFMEAYDWMSKTLHELGSLEEAQRILKRATEISPKAILRHQTLGRISQEINDYDTAEEAFRSAIDIGKHSCFKGPVEYTGLAKTLLKKDASEEALSVLETARQEFKGNRDAILQTVVTEGIIYKETNREDEAKKTIEEANKLLTGMSGKIPVEATLDLAKMCFEMGDKETGTRLMKDIVKNNHDNQKVIDMVQDIFTDATLEDEGQKMISSTRDEIIRLNNKGVRLVEDEKYEEAIEYFKKAANGLPENKIINANAAHALLIYMEKMGTNDQYIYQALQYLEKVKAIDPADEKYQKLLNMYEKITTSKIHQGA